MKLVLNIGPVATGGYYWELTREGEDVHVGSRARYETPEKAREVGTVVAKMFGIGIIETTITRHDDV